MLKYSPSKYITKVNKVGKLLVTNEAEPFKTFVIFIYIFVTPEGKTIDKVN